MPVAPLTGPALTAARDLAGAYEDGHGLIVYLGPERGVLDEATITATWLPGAGWSDVTAQVLLSEGITIAHDGPGKTISFTVADESRLVFRDDLAIAVVARHWFPASKTFGGWYVAAWGYLDGSGRSALGVGLDQTGQREATYHGYWGLARAPAIMLGRRNLASAGSIVSSSPPLLNPDEEVLYGEYLSQDSCAPQKAIDGTVDSVAVADLIADPAIPTIGQSYVPKFLRVYGPHTRGVAAGGEPRFVELSAGYNILRPSKLDPNSPQWGTFSDPGIVPAPEGNTSASIARPGFLETAFSNGYYVVHAFRQAGNQNNSVYVQWNIGSDWHGVPALIRFRVRTREAASIGLHLHFQHGHSGTNNDLFVRLGTAWQQVEVPIDSLGSTGELAGGTMIRFRANRNDLYLSDVWFDLDDVELWVGYVGAWYTKREGRALFLGMDNGAGSELLLRLANLNGGNEINIPPRGSIIVCDDIPTFKQKFGDTGQLLLQTKLDYPQWFFAPGVGRMKLAWGNDPQRLDYDDPQPVGPVVNYAQQGIEEIVFAAANGGVPWQPWQSLARQNPLVTGLLAVEDFPQTGFVPTPYDSAYWQIDLGAYDAPTLTQAMGTTSLRIPVSDVDAYTSDGYGTFNPGGERVWWSGKEGSSLVVIQRGFGGTTAAAHEPGDRFIPDTFGGVYQSTGIKQTGWNVDVIEIRRKPGTAQIVGGAVLHSNQVAPGNPSEGGSKWERHPDWTLARRFAGNASDVIAVALGVREMRHICVVIDQMARVGGVPQRAKVNEIVALEWRAGGAAAGRWVSPQVDSVADAIAHVLTRYGGVPVGKVQIAVPSPALRDLVIAPTTVEAAVRQLAEQAGLRVWTDRTNAVVIDADPANPAYRAQSPHLTIEPSLTLDGATLSWARARAVAQVRVAGREAGTMRDYTAWYPRTAAPLGKIEEARDLLFRVATDALATAILRFRAANARRALSLSLGALPWLEPGQRLLVELPGLDLGGGATGLNVQVGGYTIEIGTDDGGVTWRTALTLPELAL